MSVNNDDLRRALRELDDVENFLNRILHSSNVDETRRWARQALSDLDDAQRRIKGSGL